MRKIEKVIFAVWLSGDQEPPLDWNGLTLVEPKQKRSSVRKKAVIPKRRAENILLRYDQVMTESHLSSAMG